MVYFDFIIPSTTIRMKTLVSVIIPMYKVANFLPQCLSQIKAQTYKHLELIFVDDCSPDNASEIIQEHQAELEALGMQVVLIRHAHNQGVASARNTALDVAKGEFIYSLDADDFIEANTLELMIQSAKQEQADIVGCECTLRYDKSERHLPQVDVRTGKEAFEKMCKGVFKWNLWLFLFRRELLGKAEGEALRFLPQRNMGEDMLMMGRLFLMAERIHIIHKPLYHYVKTNEEAQTSEYSPLQWQNVKDNLKALEGFITQRKDKEELRLINFLKLNLKLPLIISTKASDYQHWSECYPEANAYIMQNDVLALRTKLLQKLAQYKQWWLVRLYNLIVMQWLYKLLYK